MHWISKGAVLIESLHTQQALAATFPCREVSSKWLTTLVSCCIGPWIQVLPDKKIMGIFILQFVLRADTKWSFWRCQLPMVNEWVKEMPQSCCYISLVVCSYHPLVVWGKSEVTCSLWFDSSSEVNNLQGGVYISSSWLGPGLCIRCHVNPAFSSC